MPDRARRRFPGRRPLIGVAALLLSLGVSLGVLLAWPLPAPLFEAPHATAVLDRDGRLLAATIAADGQWRFAPVQSVPPRFADALLTFEDRRFRHHPGVDPLAVLRAARDNVRQGRVVSGGSTLTMQLARQIGPPRARTLRSKVYEAWLALRLEWRHDKDTLLALYASHAPFGGNVVGLNAAAWRYFDRPPEALSWAEAAVLAVLPNNPALLHPGRNRDALAARRDGLLQRLHARGALDDLELSLALAEPLPDAPRPLPREAPHLLATLTRSATASDGIYRTTLDGRLQSRVSALADHHGRRLAAEGIQDLALVVVDHRDMTVQAYVGNHRAGAADRPGAMLDLVRRPRSNGSLLKPFLYALMLDEGLLLPETLVADIPTQFAGYSPENFDRLHRGAVPAREALARSLNVPMVRMLRDYGVDRFHDQLRRLGLTSLFRAPDDYGLTLILGGSEASLWELTGLYANLTATARDGVRHAPRMPALLQQSGQAVPVTPVLITPVLSQGASWLTLDALIDVVRPGHEGLWRQFGASQPIAWKTGTSFGLRDGWAIGSNGRYTVGVWTGNAEGQGVPGLTGTLAAAPLMLEVFGLLGAVPWLREPVQSLQTLTVCADDGYLVRADCPTREARAPRGSHFSRVSPHYTTLHLDAQGYRVHAGCERPAHMQPRAWFQLPPVQAFFWRSHTPGYAPPPPWRSDCLEGLADYSDEQVMGLLYPQDGTRLMVPVDLDGRLGKVLFRAVHRDPRASVRWHINDRFQAETRHFHDLALRLPPGWHRITLVDQHGQRLEQWVQVLARDTQGA